MNEMPKVDAPPEESNRFLQLSKLGIVVALLIVAGGVGAVIYVTAMGGELYKIEETQNASPFGDELNFNPDEQLMYTLSHLGGRRAAAAVEKMVASGDKRYIPVLIEMLEAGETQPIMFGAGAHRHIAALRKLAGEFQHDPHSFESLGRQWRMWFTSSNIDSPDGFTAWKGKIYGRFDDAFEDFFKNEYVSSVRVSEILYGGVKVDEIPTLDHPQMLPADKADYLVPDEVVFGVEMNGDARAYPQRILDWHELVNDDVGGVPVTVAYCPLSSAGIAYDRRAPDGTTYTFATSGLIYRSNKLMFDRETGSLWSQLTGSRVLGPSVAAETALKKLPIVLTSWKDWKQAHPQTTVLDLNTGYKRRYEPGASYGDYYSSDRVMFPIVAPNDALPRKERIFGLCLDQARKAYPVSNVAARKIVNDSIGTSPVVLVALEGTLSVSGKLRRRGESLDFSYDAGGAVRAYERGEETFAVSPDGAAVVDAAGKTWKATEAALVGPDGKSLKRVPGFESYWFAWSQYYPDAPLDK